MLKGMSLFLGYPYIHMMICSQTFTELLIWPAVKSRVPTLGTVLEEVDSTTWFRPRQRPESGAPGTQWKRAARGLWEAFLELYIYHK